MRRHWPLIRVLIASWLSYAVVLVLNFSKLPPLSSLAIFIAAIGFLSGWIYTHFFEWGYHNYAMHINPSKIPSRPKFLKKILIRIRETHIEHHTVFYGDHFRRHDLEAFKHVISPLAMFPVLFFVFHYSPLKLVLPARPLWIVFLVFFCGGLVSHYSTFESIHWFTHIDGTCLDPFFTKYFPGPLKHHLDHHEEVLRNFNFMPPYLGDRLGATYRAPDNK